MADDLSQYGTVSNAPVDLSAYGTTTPAPGFWESFKAALPHPIDALREWAAGSSRPAAALDALGVLNKIAAENPANKGLPPGKQKMLREPTPAEQAIIDRGMNGMNPEGNILGDIAAPAAKAAEQVGQGNLPGAAGTLAGGYVAPAVVAAAVPYVAPAVRTAADFVNQPGTGAILKGGAKVVGGVKLMSLGGVEGLGGGAYALSEGVGDIKKGLGKRAAAQADAAATADAAAKQAAADEAARAADAASRGPNPLGTTFTSSTADPAAANASVYGPQPAPLPTPATNTAAAYRGTGAPLPMEPPAAPLQGPLPEGHPADATRYAQPPATPTPAPAPAPTPYDATGDALRDTYKKNAANADEVKAQWMFDKGITSDQLKPGQSFKDLVDQIPNPNAKSGKFTTRMNDADHPQRVQAVADLLDAKHAQAASTSAAAALRQAGTSSADAAKMTPEQLGLPKDATPKVVADVLFQLKKLELQPPPSATAP